MFRLFSNPRFLAVYSGVLTLAFVATTAINVWQGSHRVAAAERHDFRHPDFDQLTVRRINVVEPDGTPRLIISDKAEFPGEPFKGAILPRADRSDAAGMLFMNDEGTEDGGLIFAGHQAPDGSFHSSGHLSFDEYEQDQTLSMDESQDGTDRETAYAINDNASSTLFTPEVLKGFSSIKTMPDGPAKRQAWKDLLAKYPVRLPQRALLGRLSDKSAVLLLRDPDGHIRIRLRVAPDGTPSMQFLDAAGKVTHEWPEVAAAPAK